MKEKLKKNNRDFIRKVPKYTSNRAITLTSLIIYVTMMFVVLAAITRLIVHFRSNMVEVADVNFETQFEKLNLYLLDETKTTGNEIINISEDEKEITFSSKNKYTYNSGTKEIYLNDNVKVCEQVENCSFSDSITDNSKIKLEVTLKVGDTEKTVNYIMIREDERGPLYTKKLLVEKEVLTTNAVYVEKGKTAVIPKGFKISDKKEEQSITNGLVIKDEEGNEYVWVPVEDGKLDRTEWSNNEPTGTISSDYTETLTEDEDLVNSVKINKGFYIGRYEAGSNSVRTKAGADTLTEVLTKKGLYPYNFVSQTNAISKIAEMYTEDTYGVNAILPYGAMWDETLRFVKDDEHNVTDSTNWGNYTNATFKFTEKYCTAPGVAIPTYTEGTNIDKPENTSWLLTTGASERNKAKNIYDLAGNVREWTQESSSTSNRVSRGGSYERDGYYGNASYRFAGSMDSTGSSIGFRPAIYIK